VYDNIKVVTTVAEEVLADGEVAVLNLGRLTPCLSQSAQAQL
jgi:hypothetical protein